MNTQITRKPVRPAPPTPDMFWVILHTVAATLFALLFIAGLVAVLMDYRGHLLTAFASLLAAWMCAKDAVKSFRKPRRPAAGRPAADAATPKTKNG